MDVIASSVCKEMHFKGDLQLKKDQNQNQKNPKQNTKQ